MERIIKIFSCILILLASSPLFILIAILVKLTSKGSIFFVQQRAGLHGKQFNIIKFRTMLDVEKPEKYSQREDKERITLIGEFLRKSHLDELPQLINVIKGDMNFVGPRPASIREHKILLRKVPEWNNRLLVKPGITSLAIVKRVKRVRTFDCYKEILKNDLWYIKNGCNVKSNVIILLLTFVRIKKDLQTLL